MRVLLTDSQGPYGDQEAVASDKEHNIGILVNNNSPQYNSTSVVILTMTRISQGQL